MTNSLISKETFKFLSDLRQNNNRPWFDKNKGRYALVKEESKTFLNLLEEKMNAVDQIEKTKLFRIYRDVRFSKDKTPYNSHISMSMNRLKPHLRGGYFLKITPGGSMMACGFWGPESSDIKRVRANIDLDPNSFREAMNNETVVNFWGPMEGDAVKTAPKGYDKNHPAIDLLRYKQYLYSKSFTDKEVMQKGFIDTVVNGYQSVRPFFNYMSEILTHNLNGEPLY